MNDFLGISSTTWTAIGSLAGIASLLVAILIAVFVQLASSRTATAARKIDKSVAELTRLSRRDELLRQLRAEADPGHLRLLIAEGRTLTAGRPGEQLALEKAYYTNPASPLPADQNDLPAELGRDRCAHLLHAVIDALPGRYPAAGDPPAAIGADLARLVRLALDFDVGTGPVAAFLLDRGNTGWILDDATIRRILHPEAGSALPPNLEAASGFLYALTYRTSTPANLINVIAGVSLAACDFHSGAQRLPPGTAPYSSFITLMQRKLLRIGASPEDPGATISTDHAIAVMVHAIGLVAGQEEHLNMRALEALNPLLASFPAERFTSSGLVAEHLTAGVALLLQVPAPEMLQHTLRTEALRLAPSLSAQLADLPG